jgi:ribA/ribD-fused uncharacterized protein
MFHTIYFNKPSDKHGFLSNYAAYPVVIDGVTWPTTEHYFHAMKFGIPERIELIKHCSTPLKAAKLAQFWELPRNWPEVREQIMYNALCAKFNQHVKLKNKLISTGDAVLIYNMDDNHWGIGQNQTGNNMLGVLLMQLRESFTQTFMDTG